MEENKSNEVVSGETTQTEETHSDEQDKVTMTREELSLLLQKEGDKRVTNALKTAEKKNQDKVREAEKLARMNADEKYAYELEQREKAIEAKEQELALAENKNAASAILSDKGLSLRLVDFVVDTDADVMNERIKLLDSEFKKSVKAEVEKRLGAPAPVKSNVNIEELTFEKIRSIKDGSVLQKIKNEQPELWNDYLKQLNS